MVALVADLQNLIDGLLLDAEFAGLSFSMVDSRDEAGRRAVRVLFPGRDDSAFQDLGVNDGTIRINGLLVGDDYVAQAEAMRQAFRTAGPQTLLHPWMGEILVVLAALPTISFAQKELRLARFEATFWPFYPRDAEKPDTLSALLAAGRALRSQIRSWLRGVLAPVAVTLAVYGYVQRFASEGQAYWDNLTAGAPGSSGIAGAAAPATAGLASVGGIAPGPLYADAVTTAIAAPSAAIAATSNPVMPSAVAPGGSLLPAPAEDPRLTAGILLAFATLIADAYADPAPGPALALANQALALADATAAASDIVYSSQTDALAWRDQVAAALQASITRAAAASIADAQGAGQIWNSLTDLRTAWMTDMNAVIGRLPVVVALAVPNALPAWLIAWYLTGDAPEALVGVYQDLVTRNSLTNPASVPPGSVEVLQ